MAFNPWHPTGWITQPIGSDTPQLNAWRFCMCYWYALSERYAITGSNDARRLYPQASTPYSTATFTSVTDNGNGTWTFNASDYNAAWWCSEGSPRWVNFTPSEECNGNEDLSAASNYDLAIYLDPVDPRYHFRAPIVNNTSGTITISAQPRWLLNVELSDFVDVTGDIIDHRGYMWSERIPEPPNDIELEVGTATQIIASSGLIDITKAWPKNKWQGKDILLQATDSQWYRATVTSNDTNSIILDMPSGKTPEISDYSIMNTGAWFDPDRRSSYQIIPWVDGEIDIQTQGDAWTPHAWYRGYLSGRVSHDPTDVVSTTPVAETHLTRFVGETFTGCDYEDVNDLLDNDLRNSFTDECGDSDKIWAPNIHKSFRMIQLIMQQLVPNFIEPKEYSNHDNGQTIRNFTVAEFIKSFCPSDNYIVTTITGIQTVPGDPDPFTGDPTWVETGNPLISATMPYKTPSSQYTSLDCVWAIIEPDNSIVHLRNDFGSNTTAADSCTSTLMTSATYDFQDTDVGKTLVIGFGLSRNYPREFQYYYPQERKWFEPTFVEEGEGSNWPPTSGAPGQLFTKGDTGRYIEYDKIGTISTILGDDYFNGESARYVGDSYPQPVYTSSSTDPILSGYTDKAAVVRPGLNTSFFKPSRVGTATSGSNWYLEDINTTWWQDNAYWTLSGSGNGSSTTTSLTDNKLFGSDGRFTGDNVSRFVDHVLEVSFDNEQTWEPRLITGQSSTGINVTFTVTRAFSQSTANKPYRIQEAQFLQDRWAGRTLKVRNPDTNLDESFTIDHSDNHRLFFANQDFTVKNGCSYQIIEEDVGQVYHRHNDKWQKPTPIDSTTPQDTRGQIWHRNQFENAPTIVKNYGLLRSGDYLTYNNGGVLKELYQGINQLVWTFQGDVYWTSRLDDAVPEVNERSGTRIWAAGPDFVCCPANSNNCNDGEGILCGCGEGASNSLRQTQIVYDGKSFSVEIDDCCGAPTETSDEHDATSEMNGYGPTSYFRLYHNEVNDFPAASCGKRYAYMVMTAPQPTGLDGNLIARDCQGWAEILLGDPVDGIGDPDLTSYNVGNGQLGCFNQIDSGILVWCFELSKAQGFTLGYHKWGQVGTLVGTDAENRIKCGDTDISPGSYPESPEIPSFDCTENTETERSTQYGYNTYKGYGTQTKMALIKWNVAGGIKFVGSIL